MQTHLSQSENDYKEKLEKEVSTRKDLEKVFHYVMPAKWKLQHMLWSRGYSLRGLLGSSSFLICYVLPTHSYVSLEMNYTFIFPEKICPFELYHLADVS